MFSLAPVEACQITQCSLRRPQTTRIYSCAGLHTVDWLCSWKEQRENNGAYILNLVCTRIHQSSSSCLPPLPFYTDNNKKLGYDSQYGTRRQTFKRLEPHFQTSATRSASKEDTGNAVALAHSYGSAPKELITALPNYGSIGTFGATVEQNNKCPTGTGKITGAEVIPVFFLSGVYFVFCVFCRQCNTGGRRNACCVSPFQLETPPGFQANSIPKANFVSM